MGEMKPTPGPWTVLPEEDDRDYIRIRGVRLGERYKIANVHMPKLMTTDSLREREDAESRANARLIAEAGTVFHNTGLSPVQLVEMVKELKAALCLMVRTHDEPAESLLQEVKEQQWLDRARAALAKCEGVK